MNVKQYTCPECLQVQDKVIQWQTVSVAYEFELKTGESRQVDTVGGEHETYACPNCNENLTPELGEEITRALFG